MAEIKLSVEEVTDSLRTAGREVFWYGPTDAMQIDAASEVLKQSFPPTYRHFLSLFGGGGVVGEEISGIEENDARSENKGTVTGDTARCRAMFGLPEQLVVILLVDDEVVWCIDRARIDSENESPVVSFDVFSRRADRTLYDSFADFFYDYVSLRSQ